MTPSVLTSQSVAVPVDDSRTALNISAAAVTTAPAHSRPAPIAANHIAVGLQRQTTMIIRAGIPAPVHNRTTLIMGPLIGPMGRVPAPAIGTEGIRGPPDRVVGRGQHMAGVRRTHNRKESALSALSASSVVKNGRSE